MKENFSYQSIIKENLNKCELFKWKLNENLMKSVEIEWKCDKLNEKIEKENSENNKEKKV